jgi:hypothetical protein
MIDFNMQSFGSLLASSERGFPSVLMDLVEDDPAQKPIDGIIIICAAGQTPALLNVIKGNV